MDLLARAGEEGLSNNLRQALYAARKTPTRDQEMSARYLASEEESLVLCPDGQLWVDVEAFEEAAATARRSRDPAAYRAALDLYTGELLPDDRYEEWAHDWREQLRREYLSCWSNWLNYTKNAGSTGRPSSATERVIGRADERGGKYRPDAGLRTLRAAIRGPGPIRTTAGAPLRAARYGARCRRRAVCAMR